MIWVEIPRLYFPPTGLILVFCFRGRVIDWSDSAVGSLSSGGLRDVCPGLLLFVRSLLFLLC